MFRPQPTPYLLFGAYGFGSNLLPDYSFQQSPLGAGGLAGVSGGAGSGAGAGPIDSGYLGARGVNGAGADGNVGGGTSLIFTPPAFSSSGSTSAVAGGPASFVQQQAQGPPPQTFTNANSHHRHSQPSHLGHSHSFGHGHPQKQQRQHQQQQQQLQHRGNPNLNAAHRRHPSSRNTPPSHPHSHSHSHPLPHQRAVKMEASHDMAAQEAAALEYQPDLEGPQVGEKVTSHAIAEEYAKADPVYVEKTLNLPQTYSHYRPIQGDGNCGWRAIAFGYFETLIQNNNQAQIQTELQRLIGLNDFIKNVGGIEPYIYEEMVDETFTLLKRISASLPHQDEAMAVLLSTFNTPDLSNSILYHFRLLASSQFKGNVATYEPFLTSGTPDKYSTTTLECPNVEIDHLGLVLLANVLLKPAGFVLEVAYLDRSAGAQVNTYRLPDDANGRDTAALGPIIYLLYRPTHYDILYRGPVDVQVNHASSISHRLEVAAAPGMASYSPMDMSALSVIPTLGGGIDGSLFVAADSTSPLGSYTPSPHPSWMPPSFPEDLSGSQQPQAPQGPGGPRVSPQAEVPVDAHPLRMTKYCQLPEFVENDTWREPTFTTATFKNSHYNKAHYNNPDFQPEVYNPEASEEYERADLPVRRKKGSMG